MFSARTGWDRTPNRLSGLLDEKRRAGVEVLDLTESNPTRAGIAYPDGLLTPLADAGALDYDPTPLGWRRAREAVAADYRRRGMAVDPDHVVLASGTSEAYAYLLKLLCDPGDRLLVPRPSYPLFDFLAGLESVELASYPLAYDGVWSLDAGELARIVTPDSRAVITVHPNNPTGSYLKDDEVRTLGDLCSRRGLAVISDEVFADYALRDDRARAVGVAGVGDSLGFALGGLSKSCGLPQLKLAWIAVAGPAKLRDEALARLEIVADTYLSVGTPVQRAAPELLARLPELQRPIAARVRANLATLRAAVSGTPASLLDAEGGWSAVLQVPATRSEEERAAGLLARRNVLVHPGYFFGFAREAYLVLSLLPPPSRFATGVQRILDDL